MSKLIAVGAALALAAGASAQSFSNPTPILIPGTGTSGPASPYSSDIVVSGVSGATGVEVSLLGLTHTFPADIDVLLVAPGGTCIVMSDIGGGTDVVGIDLTFVDGGAVPPAALVTGTYAPTNIGTGDTWPAPAPAGPYGSTLNNLAASPNGTWSLYVFDDAGGDSGSMDGGWRVNFVPAPSSFALLGLGGLLVARRRR